MKGCGREKAALRNAATGAAEGAELRGTLLTTGGCCGSVDLKVAIAGRRGFSSAARGLFPWEAVTACVHHLDTVVGGAGNCTRRVAT